MLFKKSHSANSLDTVKILSFRTDMFGQIVQTQIRLLLEQSDQVYTVCHSSCIFWPHYSMVEPHSSNFRVITTNFFGVRIFRKFSTFSCVQCSRQSWHNWVEPQMMSLLHLHHRISPLWMYLCSAVRQNHHKNPKSFDIPEKLLL